MQRVKRKHRMYKWDLKTNKIFINRSDLPKEMDRLYSEEKQDKLKWLNKDIGNQNGR